MKRIGEERRKRKMKVKEASTNDVGNHRRRLARVRMGLV